jgi:hypothetical protein
MRGAKILARRWQENRGRMGCVQYARPRFNNITRARRLGDFAAITDKLRIYAPVDNLSCVARVERSETREQPSGRADPRISLSLNPGYCCVAKTQYSFSTNADTKGAPTDHTINVREVRLSAGAEFVVAICGEIMTMPGLPRVPARLDRHRYRWADRRSVLISP